MHSYSRDAFQARVHQEDCRVDKEVFDGRGKGWFF